MAIHVELTEEIEAPPERVFEVLSDLDRAGEWMPNLVGIERLDDGEIGVGSRWRETRKMFGREATEEFELTALDPPRSVEVFVDGTKGSSKKGEFRFRYDLRPAGEGTRVELHGEISGMGRIGELIGRLFVGGMKKMLAKDLAAMKAYAEKGQAGA